MNYSFISPDTRHRVNAFASFMKVQRESYYGGGETPVSDFSKRPRKHRSLPKTTAEMNKRMVSYGRTKGYTGVLGAQYAYDFERLFFMPSQFTVGVEYNHDDLEDKSGFRTNYLKTKCAHGFGLSAKRVEDGTMELPRGRPFWTSTRCSTTPF